MRDWRLLVLVLVLGLLAACGDESASGYPDGDQDDFQDGDWDTGLDGDLDGDRDTDAAETGEDEFPPDDKDPDGDLEPEDEYGEDADLDDDVELDGDLTDGDDMTDGDGDVDGDLEEEQEVEPPPRCLSSDSPFDHWMLTDSPSFGATPYEYEGIIEEECQTHGFLFAGAKGMRIQVDLEPLGFVDPLKARLLVTDVASLSRRREAVVFADLTDDFPLNGESMSFTLPRSGEYPILVAADNLKRTGRYRLTVRCLENCGRRFTRHPIILIHGFAGWDTFIGFYNYFFGVEADLTGRGYDVHTTQVAMFNDSNFRASELEKQLVAILRTTGARKLNLLAHSQGGIDSRRFISGMGHGEDVSALAMVATPNRGTIIGDIIRGDVPGIAQDALAAVINLFGNLIGGSQNDVKAALSQLSVAHMRDVFNPAHPDDPRVSYYSWTCVSCPLLNRQCRRDHGGEWVNPTLAVTYRLIYDNAPAPNLRANDGLVPVESARWGDFMELYNCDHWDEIGQLVTGKFDHKEMYRTIAGTLESQGH